MVVVQKKKTMRGLTREFLQKRYDDVMDDESIKQSDPLTLSTVWYRLRPQFRKAGLFKDKTKKQMKEIRRMVEYQYIRDICKYELRVKRAELGIHTAVRAQLYYRGKVYDISLDNAEELAEKGVVMIPMEKEGAAEVLAPFAAMTAIAILNSRGFFTENAETLSELAKDKLGGREIPVLHDFDASGVAISKKISGITSLGVDPELLEELGINIADVEEEYNGLDGGHWKWLDKNLKKDDPARKHLEYLKTKRVEIDSVIAVIGAERLWEVMLSRLKKKFPTLDYNRAIIIEDVIRKYTLPTLTRGFTAMAVKLIDQATTSCNEQVRKKYSKVVGFIEDIDEEERKIAIKQLNECEKSDIMDEFNIRLEEVINWLQTIIEEDEDE
jgi:hypothetical protein